jgi:hypothetical protein
MAIPISKEAIRKMVCYYYLVNFWIPDYIGELKKASRKTRTKLSRETGLPMKEFLGLVIPEVAERIMAFHSATPEPDQASIKELAKLMKGADSNPKKALAYQEAMRAISAQPERAKVDNRLHKHKGCRFCTTPCQYGYFSLMSDPNFNSMKAMLDAENQKKPEKRNAVNVLWRYIREHFWSVLEKQEGYISPYHIGNLSFCLLVLATAKSRFVLPEKELLVYQALNQRTIRNLETTVIDLIAP